MREVREPGCLAASQSGKISTAKSSTHRMKTSSTKSLVYNATEERRSLNQNKTKSFSTAADAGKRSRSKKLQAGTSKWSSFTSFRTACARVSSPGSGVGLIPRPLPRREAMAMQASKKASFTANSPSLITLSFDLSFFIDPITGDYSCLLYTSPSPRD